MTTLPIREPCKTCRGVGLRANWGVCQECGGRGFNPLAETITEDSGHSEIRDRHEEQVAGVRVIAWGFAAVVFWAFVAAVLFVMWLILKDAK